jgi:N-acetylmuramic acid 6-phosphate etherase
VHLLTGSPIPEARRALSQAGGRVAVALGLLSATA